MLTLLSKLKGTFADLLTILAYCIGRFRQEVHCAFHTVILMHYTDPHIPRRRETENRAGDLTSVWLDCTCGRVFFKWWMSE